jgi:DNA-binding response OmpR family regulator
MHNYTILFVDSDDLYRQSIIFALEADRVEALGVRSAEDAFAALQHQPFDLLIVDINSPGIRGMDFVSRVGEFYPATKVIILAGEASVEMVIEALRKRVTDFFLKPSPIEEIHRGILSALHEDQRIPPAVMEKRPQSASSSSKTLVYVLEDQVTIDIRKHIILWDLHSVVLTPTETRFLGVLLEQHNQVIQHADIVFSMHGYHLEENEAATVLRPIVSRLRKKLDSIPGGKDWIKTVRSSGYTFTTRIVNP